MVKREGVHKKSSKPTRPKRVGSLLARMEVDEAVYPVCHLVEQPDD
jgi:hypothetical protein